MRFVFITKLAAAYCKQIVFDSLMLNAHFYTIQSISNRIDSTEDDCTNPSYLEEKGIDFLEEMELSHRFWVNQPVCLSGKQ